MIALPKSVLETSFQGQIRTLFLSPYNFLSNLHLWLFGCGNFSWGERAVVSGLVPQRELHHYNENFESAINKSLLFKGVVITALGTTLLYLGTQKLQSFKKDKRQAFANDPSYGAETSTSDAIEILNKKIESVEGRLNAIDKYNLSVLKHLTDNTTTNSADDDSYYP